MGRREIQRRRPPCDGISVVSDRRIEPLCNTRGHEGQASDRHEASVPFRVEVTGTDVAGVPFRRQYPTLFRAQTVSVSVDGTDTPVTPGSTRELTVTVQKLARHQVISPYLAVQAWDQ